MTFHLPRCSTSCQLRFASLLVPGHSLAFPCDAQGHVDLDALPGRAKHNYLYARAMVGRDYSIPCVFSSAEDTTDAPGAAVLGESAPSPSEAGPHSHARDAYFPVRRLFLAE